MEGSRFELIYFYLFICVVYFLNKISEIGFSSYPIFKQFNIKPLDKTICSIIDFSHLSSFFLKLINLLINFEKNIIKSPDSQKLKFEIRFIRLKTGAVV